MAADEERAARIRQLKADRPGVTWRQISEHVGVTERAAQEWPKSGGIDYANATKLAEFMGVDPDWLWAGPKRDTPELFGDSTDMAALAARLDALHAKVDVLLAAAGVRLPVEAPSAGPVPDRLPEAPPRRSEDRRRAS